MYKTKDFYLACLIMSKGYEFLGSENKGRTVWFKFKPDKELQKLINDFINYEAVTNVRMFTRSMARLRRELDRYKK